MDNQGNPSRERAFLSRDRSRSALRVGTAAQRWITGAQAGLWQRGLDPSLQATTQSPQEATKAGQGTMAGEQHGIGGYVNEYTLSEKCTEERLVLIKDRFLCRDTLRDTLQCFTTVQ